MLGKYNDGKTKIAEKTLKDETIKELEKFKDNLKKYMVSVYGEKS